MKFETVLAVVLLACLLLVGCGDKGGPRKTNGVSDLIVAAHGLAAACYREGYEAGRLEEVSGRVNKPTEGCRP